MELLTSFAAFRHDPSSRRLVDVVTKLLSHKMMLPTRSFALFVKNKEVSQQCFDNIDSIVALSVFSSPLFYVKP